MRRYSKQQQSPISLSYLDIKTKPLVSSRMNFPTAQTRNPQSSDLLKLPSLNPMRRSFSISSTERNTKFRLQGLDEKLQQFAAEVYNTRLDAQETINHVRYLRQSLGNKQIQRVRQDLKKKAKGLERLVHSTIAADQQRYRTIRSDCAQLWNQTENIRSMLFELRIRTDNLEERMGFKNN